MSDNKALANSQKSSLEAQVEMLQTAGRDFHARGWSLATSSNYSIVISKNPIQLLMTASGKDKGDLTRADFVIVDESCQVLRAACDDNGKNENLRPSAEAPLHLMIAQEWQAGAILHTHSVWSTILSESHDDGKLSLSGLEMLKALRGVSTHETTVNIPVFDNNQDMQALSALVRKNKDSITHAFLLKGHGLYTWGTSFEEAKRHIEALEFLFEVQGRLGGFR